MKKWIILAFIFVLTACGFHLQGEMQLAPRLQRVYVQAQDPYGQLVRLLKQYLKLSKATIVDSKNEATAVLVILSDQASEDFLGVSATTQTRQYTLKVAVNFQITDNAGNPLTTEQHLETSRALTIQSNQILGTSNEASLLYQQMRRNLARDIMLRIASRQITEDIQSKHPAEAIASQ